MLYNISLWLIYFIHTHLHLLGLLRWFNGKESSYQTGDMYLIPGLRRLAGEENGNPLQYCCLENPMDKGGWWAIIYGVTKCQTQFSDWTTTCESGTCKWNLGWRQGAGDHQHIQENYLQLPRRQCLWGEGLRIRKWGFAFKSFRLHLFFFWPWDQPWMRG